ncbi:GNAT family N-acetyltransferase [Acinetobacter higginsii]|uniref:GNAT family N-acetyltransferase n=1 Tax=Acinetobacter higginsii TaxID=70347 RepID=UPI001F4B0687|nr:GNAT family N-acetyltransferase [Acinetobacter higginsii]MCH7296793.1 GNAT family N-acetyltransferase [Acinetobacter higginsii]MCI3880591.1 GNAT family N-acetyltransferase [Acinetobacter higginsii]
MIIKASQDDHLTLLNIWEKSVRATHDFLPETMIAELKPLILNEYFHHVQLNKYVIDQQIVGFLGTSDDNIEMLFILPEYRRSGIGKALLDFAVKQLQIYKVDVNEQNLQAVNFYQKMGFHTMSRSELDGQGNPYPLLHLQITA